jgi:quercetin dioxygenase-like cupin family protein
MKDMQNQAIIDADLAAVLGAALVPMGPQQDARQAMRSRLMARVRADSAAGADPAHLTMAAADGAWVKINPLAEVKKLCRTDDARCVLYRLQPGGSLPDHDHASDEECIMLQGEMCIGDLKLKAGDFHLARKGSVHRNLRSETGAMFYVRTAAA